MSTSTVEFPLSPLKGREGIVPEPILPVGIQTPHGEKLYDFLLDSGADATLLPRSVAREVGIDLHSCPTSTTQGVEGRGITIYHAALSVRIGPWIEKVRCAFASHDRIPPLLGRLDIFSRFTITFDARCRSIRFKKA